MKTVEVFKTNIQDAYTAKEVIRCFLHKYPQFRITVDLDDEDNVLRVETDQCEITATEVIMYLTELGYTGERLV